MIDDANKPGPLPVASPAPMAAAERRRRRRETALIVAASVAVVVFALWEIRRPGATDSAPGNVFSFFVVNLNIVLLLLLIFLVLRNVMKLYVERRRRVPGSRLRTRLVAAFAAIAVFPAAVMLLVSLEFSTNAIDDWFNREVEESLLGAWRLAQTYYRETGARVELHARQLAEQATVALEDEGGDAEAAAARFEAIAARYQRSYGLGPIEWVDSNGTPLASIPVASAIGAPALAADAQLISSARSGASSVRVTPLGQRDFVTAAWVIPADDGRDVGTILVGAIVEDSARLWSEGALRSFREYRKLKLNRTPFKNVYVLTMGLASLVVVFSATWLGLYLARGITEPLGTLVTATKRVAAGDWEVDLAAESEDEIGTLVQAFNSMATEVKTSHAILEERRRYTEKILGHIDAGVIAVDGNGTVTATNPAAVFLLGLSGTETTGAFAKDLFESRGYPEVADLLEGLRAGELPSGTRRSISKEDQGRTLLATATVLEATGGGPPGGFVLFFEDVSRIATAQRMEVWREVARRIAHEIKNPLTPIQLSAQRMQRRLSGQLSAADAEVLDDCTRTIVAQVDEMKRLVNEFGQFARQSVPDKRPCDLNKLVEDTLPLFSQAHPDISMRFQPDPTAPPVTIHRESVQRILINLLDNAVAAVSGEMGTVNPASGTPREIVVEVRNDAALAKVCLEVGDSGPGIAPELRGRVFEPYFSTRREGTGLGLAIVSAIAADHQAFVRCHDRSPRGCRFVVEFPASSNAEIV